MAAQDTQSGTQESSPSVLSQMGDVVVSAVEAAVPAAAAAAKEASGNLGQKLEAAGGAAVEAAAEAVKNAIPQLEQAAWDELKGWVEQIAKTSLPDIEHEAWDGLKGWLGNLVAEKVDQATQTAAPKTGMLGGLKSWVRKELDLFADGHSVTTREGMNP